MLRRRLIPVLFIKDGWMVRSEDFRLHQFIGNPLVHVERMIDWNVDELIVIDISDDSRKSFQHGRLDYPTDGASDLRDFITQIAEKCRIPLVFGGNIRTHEQIERVIKCGAEKVCLNTMLFDDNEIVKKCVANFGSQAIVASIDYRSRDGRALVYRDHGLIETEFELVEWIKYVESLGVGEILLNAIDRDGKAVGYDIEFIDLAVESTNLPTIALGGAGHQRHFLSCFNSTSVSGVAAGNLFHFTENSYPRAKMYLKEKGVNVR